MLALAAAALIGGVVAAWGYWGMRWGCPSAAEANRSRTGVEVADAFGDNGLALVRAPRQPVADAQDFRYTTARGTVRVVVCSTNACAPDVAALAGDRSRFRRGLDFLNVRVWLSASDRRTADSLLTRMEAASAKLTKDGRDSRCFPD